MFQNPKDAREVLESCQMIAILCKTRLRELPFSQRAPIEESVESLEDFLESIIASAQLSFAKTDYQEASEHLMDLGMESDDEELFDDEIDFDDTEGDGEDELIELTPSDDEEIDRRLEEIEEAALDMTDDEAEAAVEAALNKPSRRPAGRKRAAPAQEEDEENVPKKAKATKRKAKSSAVQDVEDQTPPARASRTKKPKAAPAAEPKSKTPSPGPAKRTRRSKK